MLTDVGERHEKGTKSIELMKEIGEVIVNGHATVAQKLESRLSSAPPSKVKGRRYEMRFLRRAEKDGRKFASPRHRRQRHHMEEELSEAAWRGCAREGCGGA